MISGWTAPGYEGVAEVFERNFSDRGERGAGFSAYRDGRPVVDLWGGWADPAQEWQQARSS